MPRDQGQRHDEFVLHESSRLEPVAGKFDGLVVLRDARRYRIASNNHE